jgi:hypothetical protein
MVNPDALAAVPHEVVVEANLQRGVDPAVLDGRKLHGVEIDAYGPARAWDLSVLPKLDWLTLRFFNALPRLPRVRRLALIDCRLGDRGIEALARDPLLAGVEELTIQRDYGLRSGGINALAHSPHLGALHTLSLTSHAVDSRVIDALVRLCDGLGRLDLRGSHIRADPRRLFKHKGLAVLGIDQLSDDEWARLRKEAPPSLGRVMAPPTPLHGSRWGRGWTFFDD